LRVRNRAELSRGIHVDWPLAKPSRKTSIELDDIEAYVGPQPLVSRSYAISIMGRGQSVVIANSKLICSENARACQAVMCYGVAMCRIHDNQITMEKNLTATSGRAILFDGHTEGGEAWNNTVTVNNNRAVRIRDSQKIRVHHNKFLKITAGQSGLAAIHVGDPDGGGFDVLHSSIDHNRFESTGGDIVFGRGVDGLDFSDNDMLCDGVCNAAVVARLRLHQKSRVRFRGNTVSGFAPPQIRLDAGSEAVLCDTQLVASGGIVTKTGCD
jgi:hypothetical protein